MILLLSIAAMFLFSVATHYCGGFVAATKVSLTGELATCGMENDEKEKLSQETFTRHCCDDVLTYCTTDNNYAPSFSVFPQLYENNLQKFNASEGVPYLPSPALSSLKINVNPSGVFVSTQVDLSDICVFRI
jgi:hypothetical protein